MIRIALDGRCLNTPHLRGMGKALLQLLRQAADERSVSFVVLSDEPQAPLQVPDGDRLETRVWEVRGDRLRAWEQVGLPRMAARLGCDLLHCPGTWAPLWQPLPTIVTLHDTLAWDDPEATLWARVLLPRALQRARAIITPSASSRGDILARWPRFAAKVVVVPWGIDQAYLAQAGADRTQLTDVLDGLGVRRPYLLYLGGRIPRKRLDWAVRTWRGARAGRSDLSLIVCGLEPEAHGEWSARVPAEDRPYFTCLGFVPEISLPSLYAGAEAVLYPTLYEGFGFPALESQAVGTPVLMSAVGSLQELAGPGAIVLPPHDLDAWISACRTAPTRAVARAPAARDWATQFTWASAFRRTLRIYEAVASGRPVVADEDPPVVSGVPLTRVTTPVS